MILHRPFFLLRLLWCDEELPELELEVVESLLLLDESELDESDDEEDFDSPSLCSSLSAREFLFDAFVFMTGWVGQPHVVKV